MNAASANECQITQRSQKIFYCMAKRQQEIHVPGKMNDACVKGRKTVTRRQFHRAASPPLESIRNVEQPRADLKNARRLAQMMTAESSHVAHGLRCSSGASNSTGIPRNAAICFHDSSGAALSRSEPRPVWTTARLLRSRASRALFPAVRSDRFRLARNEPVNFVSVEPDEMAVLADIDVDFRPVG